MHREGGRDVSDSGGMMYVVTKPLGKRETERWKQREEARDINNDSFIGCDRWRSC